MKLTVKREVEAKYIDLALAVRYDDEDLAYDAPLRDGNSWKALINLDEGCIENWPVGKRLSFHDMKVCDEGIYILLDADRKEITRRNGYAPNRLLPGNYGDYLSLDVDENGKITNWLKSPSLEDFEDE